MDVAGLIVGWMDLAEGHTWLTQTWILESKPHRIKLQHHTAQIPLTENWNIQCGLIIFYNTRHKTPLGNIWNRNQKNCAVVEYSLSEEQGSYFNPDARPISKIYIPVCPEKLGWGKSQMVRCKEWSLQLVHFSTNLTYSCVQDLAVLWPSLSSLKQASHQRLPWNATKLT